MASAIMQGLYRDVSPEVGVATPQGAMLGAAAPSLMASNPAAVMAASPAETKEWNSRYAGRIPHTNSYYAKCLFGGVLACGTAIDTCVDDMLNLFGPR